MKQLEYRRLFTMMKQFESVHGSDSCSINEVRNQLDFIFGDEVSIIDEGKASYPLYYGRFVRYEHKTDDDYLSPSKHAIIRLWESESEEPFLHEYESSFYIGDNSVYTINHV
jgi:hypothetical protein